MQFVQSFAHATVVGFAMMAWIFITLWGVERLFPKDRPPERIQLRSLRFWFFYAVAGALIGTAWAILQRNLGLHSLYVLSLRDFMPAWAAYIVLPLAGVITYDFFNYWMHRAQHKWFWRQHAIHHSIEHLSAVNSYFHPTEDLFRVAFITLPMTLFFGLDGYGATFVAGLFVLMQGNFIHSASSLHFGKVGRLLFADNRWHRIHHSVQPEHFDRNFGTSCTLWDRLFGTAYFPENDEWPETGVHDEPEPQTVGDFLLRPFTPSGTRQSAPYSPSPTHSAPRPL